MLYHPDTATGALSQKRTTLAFDANAQNNAPTGKTNYSKGFAKRKVLHTANTINNVLNPLQGYVFFLIIQR